jgi:high affinity cGMP-specific 3',5'-cyclic phosphodiesterase 9
VKELLETKKKKYLSRYDHSKIKPDADAIASMKLNFDVRDWNFNALDQSANCLLVTVKEIYERLGFLSEFSISIPVLVDFLWQCHYFYTRNNNPFHNFFHSVTVTHAGFYFLDHVAHLSSLLSSHLKLAFITACLGHDLDHRGRNNDFEVNSGSKLAIRYFDKSPLENHHAATLFTILKSPESNILKNVPDDKLKDIKHSIIENILATDMKLHFPLLAEFKKKLADSPDFCKLP